MPLNKLHALTDAVHFLLPAPVRMNGRVGEFWKCRTLQLEGFTISSRLPEGVSAEISKELVSEDLGFDSFFVEINSRGAAIQAVNERGLLYAMNLLAQLQKLFQGEIPPGEIQDGAALKDRGYMLDVSRSRIPGKKQFIELLNYLSLLRFNHLELYLEHTFAYAKHKRVWEGTSALTAAEIEELDQEAAKRGIELVPNQNSFGHMRGWLEHEAYRHLAESPEGFDDPWGNRRDYPFSFSPAVPEVFTLLAELYNELLPNFSSRRFNVGLDETFDLGQGRSRELCKQQGKGRVYLDYLKKIQVLVSEREHTMLFWDDIIQNHTELISELPESVTAVEWGYEDDHDFSGRCRLLQEHKISFLTAPGTSLWNTAAGRYRNACSNIDLAAEAAESSGGKGMLLTDWGDNGHIPPPILGWPLIAYSAARGWQGSNSEIINPVHWFLSTWLQVKPNQLDEFITCYKTLSSLDDLAGSRIMNGSILASALFSFDTPVGRGQIHEFEEGKIVIYRDAIDRLKPIIPDLTQQENPRIRRFADSLHFALLFAEYALEVLKVHKGQGILKHVRQKAEMVSSMHQKMWHADFRPGGFAASQAFLLKAIRHFTETEESNDE